MVFFKENTVSEDIQKDERKFLKQEENLEGFQWKQVIDFLSKALSSKIALGVTTALSVYGGYKLGTNLDNRFHFYPLFTFLCLMAGIGIGGLTTYMMILKFFKPNKENTLANIPTTASSSKATHPKQNYPIINVTIDQVRQAIRTFSDQLPKGVYRTILVKDDNEIDFTMLAHILGGIPSDKFYMSKETYDLFTEAEKLIPYEMDMVQKAVDLYVKDHKEFPMLTFDPLRRVNYFQLIQEHYLKAPPETQFYMTDLDGLITHLEPGRKAVE